jgi:peptidoglycan/xylan/chitin deacetylase (PgdA/CDA1 family)
LPSIRLRARLCGIAAALLVLSSGATNDTALAAETRIDGFTAGTPFGLVWREGTLESGRDAQGPFARVTTDGAGHPSLAAHAAPLATPIDARGRFVKLWLRVDDRERLGGLEFRLYTGGAGDHFFGFEVPIFADPEADLVQSGAWTTLSWSFGAARVVGSPDRSRIDTLGWWVIDRGDAKPVTADLGGVALVDAPEQGVVSLTFDDGYDEHVLAADLMAAHGFRGTAYVIPHAFGRPGHLTHAEAAALRDRFDWDVAAHHETPFPQLSAKELERAIVDVRRALERGGFARGSAHLAYPLGKQDPAVVRPLVRRHFATARVASGGAETLPPADPHLMRAWNVTNTTSPEAVGAAARRAHAHGEWLILMLHRLVEEPTLEVEYSIADFRALLDELTRAGVRVLPVSEVWKACAAAAATPAAPACSFPPTRPPKTR